MSECRYWGMCRICYGNDCDGIDGACNRYEPMPDVEALKALADKMEQKANGWDVTQGDVPLVHAGHLLGYADRIREALGVEDFKPYVERCATANEEGCSA